MVAASARATAAEIDALLLQGHCYGCMRFVVACNHCLAFARPLYRVLGVGCMAIARLLCPLCMIFVSSVPLWDGLCRAFVTTAHETPTASRWAERSHNRTSLRLVPLAALRGRLRRRLCAPRFSVPLPEDHGRGAGGARRRRACRAGLSRELARPTPATNPRSGYRWRREPRTTCLAISAPAARSNRHSESEP